jgi:hypothetical protein
MDFKITEEQARTMALLEEEVGCDISAGPDYGSHLDRVLELAIYQVDLARLISLLLDEVGDVLSRDEIEEVAGSFQAQVQDLITAKVVAQRSA